MKVTYYIENDQDKIEYSDDYEDLIKKAVECTLEYEGITGDREISVTFTDNEKIKILNKQFRNIDKETDVLSFPIDDEGEDVVLGDVVISLEKAEEQAKEYGHSLEREISFLCVHSCLHLLGYDHEKSEEDEKTMFAKQEEILEKIGQKR